MFLHCGLAVLLHMNHLLSRMTLTIKMEQRAFSELTFQIA
jgi:hypothetical protein